MTIRTTAPFRADIVGSFLRPQQLKQARIFLRQGLINENDLKAVEDMCIRELVAKQIKSGLKVITDGEFRRSWWHFDFMWGLHGVSKAAAPRGYKFHDEDTRAETAKLTGKVSGENHPFVEHFKFVNSLKVDGVQPRQTIPAPAQLLATLLNVRGAVDQPEWAEVYEHETDLIEDIARAYRTVIRDLYNAGCRSLQFDDCTFPVLCDENIVKGRGLNAEALLNKYLTVNNLAIEGRPSDLTLTTHLCRGNYHSTYFASGSYDKVAARLFGEENVDAYYLEFDDERSGGFECLKQVSDNKLVVLGLITSKRPQLEDKDVVIARIHEAAKYIDLDRLCLSPQCGFSSTEEGNKLTDEDQWKKIALIQDIAREVWGED